MVSIDPIIVQLPIIMDATKSLVIAASVSKDARSILSQPLPSIPVSDTLTTVLLLTHTGPFNAQSRENPTLAFYEKYVEDIKNINLSTMYPDWYALECTFYNSDGTFYRGGPAIKTWIEGLFGSLSHIGINHHAHRVLPYEASPAVGDEGVGDPQDITNQASKRKCTRLLTEHDMVFYLKGNLSGPGISVRRTMSWVLGPAQVEGQGTDGLQWYEGRVWWDTNVLTKEIAKRQAKIDESL